jgi:hypothetical protein
MSNKSPGGDFKRFSDAISDPLIKAYRAGGLVLTLLTLGAILMLTAFFWNQPGPVRYVVLLVGTVLTFFTLAYVYFKEFPRVKRARESVVANREMIDAIQQSAIELTAIASELQALAFKNANQIAEVLTVARPLMRKIPLLGAAADSEAMVKAEGLSRLIVTSTQSARKVIADLQKALVEANPEYLKSHLEDLRRYRAEVDRMLIGEGP